MRYVSKGFRSSARRRVNLGAQTALERHLGTPLQYDRVSLTLVCGALSLPYPR
jgi:hypothetical protein